MVARIKTSKSIRRILQYNEQKCREGVAVLLAAANFFKDEKTLRFQEKLSTFCQLQSLNERTKTNSLHIFLSFDPSEKIGREKAVQIATDYMQQIGFGEQPYLVYRHDDAGHPHLHLVTTNIRWDGSRIGLHNIGQTVSEKAREAIERKYGLVNAKGKNNSDLGQLNEVWTHRVTYGKGSTKRAMAKVLSRVIEQYNYSSLEELNAILGLYNVIAERGTPGSRLYASGGLLYQALNDWGAKVGTPIKASAFYQRPTWKRLEWLMQANQQSKRKKVARIKRMIDFNLVKPRLSLTALTSALHGANIQVLFRQSGEGYIYGLTFIDHEEKVVVNGRALGERYSARRILQRCGIANEYHQHTPLAWRPPAIGWSTCDRLVFQPETGRLFADLLLPEQYNRTFVVNGWPHGIGKKKRRRQQQQK